MSLYRISCFEEGFDGNHNEDFAIHLVWCCLVCYNVAFAIFVNSDAVNILYEFRQLIDIGEKASFAVVLE